MKSPIIRRVREALGRPRVANASALSAIALGVVGVMLGTGLATTAIGVSDGITWLADTRSGAVLQYNPSTKRVERSYQVGRPGDDISVAQDSGIVALRNERTGDVITVDMSRLRAAGARAAGGPSKVLVAKGMMVLVDRDRGILRRIDPVKAYDLGETWQSAAPVADAVADQQGTVWVMVADGHLRALAWNDQRQRFDQTFETRIQRVADDGLLAAHPTGVTVFGPRAGVIAQVGTSNDSYRQSNQLVGIAPQGTEGPSDLVVGALANSSSVVFIDRGEVRQVSTAELGCVRPINPAAFNGRVYVVCQGGNKVIQLGRDGRVAGPEIVTPGSGDAQPVADEGRLVLNVSGAREGIEIDRAGTDQRFDRTAEVVTPTMRVESKPTNEGIEIGREQARSDLAVEPLPDQPDSGSGNVNTRTEDFEDRTEVVDGGSSPSATPSEETPLPEAAVEIQEPPAPEPAPRSSGIESLPADRERTPRPERTRPAPNPDGAATTSGSGGAGVVLDTDEAAMPGSDRGEASVPPAAATEAAPAPPALPENPAPTVSAESESEVSPPSGSAFSDPAATGPTPGPTLTGFLGEPTASTAKMTPSPARSGPIPTPATSRATAGPAATPASTATPVLGTPAGATTRLATSTALSSTPAPLAAPARLGAKASGRSVTVTWAYSGDADHFEVAVGGRSVRVVKSARTATVTGNDPGTKTVTVTAVRGGTSRSTQSTVTVGSPATAPMSGTPTSSGAVNTPPKPTSSSTGLTPTPTRSAGSSAVTEVRINPR